MNIIIVAKPFSTPRVLRLGDWRSYAVVGTGLTLAVSAIFAVGAVLGARYGAPIRLKADLDEARRELTRQSESLADVRAGVSRDMDALALRLGQLQAEAARLNALGERLAKAGKLDDGEFDFDQPPALGGPARPVPGAVLDASRVEGALEQLEAQLDRQAQQLGVLESVLLDREVDQSLLPAGVPVRAGYKSSGFGMRADPFHGGADFHSGIDFNGQRNSDILAVAGGVVSFVGRKPGYGNLVEIDHGNGYMTRYGHNERNLVAVGDAVKAGDVIAKMGSTGRATGVHVHFEVWLDGRPVNPAQYVKAMRG